MNLFHEKQNLKKFQIFMQKKLILFLHVISPEQLKFLKSLFEEYLSTSKVADFESGYASKEQAFDKLHTGYNDFKKRYGFRPYKAGELHKIINFCD